MCTVVVRRSGGARLDILALRDEDASRDFDEPGFWWPSQPSVVGGRDRRAGGAWCATHVATGVTALLLNRFERPVSAPGAPSRGVLPLAACASPSAWSESVDPAGMASFTLVVLGPGVHERWTWDGDALSRSDVVDGTSMITSGAGEDGRVERHLSSYSSAEVSEWLRLLGSSAPIDDRSSMLVRHEHDGHVFATVFGQLVSSTPAGVVMSGTRTPWEPGSWREISTLPPPGG